MSIISNWGNTPEVDANVIPFHQQDQLKALIGQLKTAIPRGMGRCYGDSALNDTIIDTTNFNQMLRFDSETGIIICEAGITLAAMLKQIIQKGWFLPVTPGTKFVTVGGAVAANVHGKNHHNSGSLSHHIIYIDVLTHDGSIIRCSKDEHSDLFYMTCGGMGLTGIIVEVSLQLIPIESAYIRKKTIRLKNLAAIMDAFEEHKDWTYSVAWIDCLATGDALGRSVLMLGEHAKVSELSKKKQKHALSCQKKLTLRVPFFFPNWVLATWSVRLFNHFYYSMSPSSGSVSITDYDSFFYPLDHIHDWNKCYGKRGFTQYQCVFPLESSKDGLTELLHQISASGEGSFLAVLKRFGVESLPGISFPMDGYTLALDFPMNQRTCQLMERLDTIVGKYNGRIYLAKDSRMSASFFKSSYKNSASFIKFKKTVDQNQRFQSLQSERLTITE